MSFHADLVARLNAAVPIFAGWSWFERPRSGNFPAGVITLINPGPIYSHDGPDDLNFATVQFDIYGHDPIEIVAGAAALRSEMELADDGAGINIGGTHFHPAFLRNERTVPPHDLGDGSRIFGIQQDYNFHHQPV